MREVQVSDIVPTNPREQRAGRIGVACELRDRVLIVLLGRRGSRDARAIVLDVGEIGLLDLGFERGGFSVVRIDREEEILAVCEHGVKRRAYDGVIGVDERVVRVETVEREGE